MPRVVHFEIPADDPQRATAFYAGVFGWTINQWQSQPYWMAITGPDDEVGINGAIMPRGDHVNSLVNTVQVAALDETLAAVTRLGGTVLTDKQEIPEVGTFAYCRDTEGNTFGVIQPPAG